MEYLTTVWHGAAHTLIHHSYAPLASLRRVEVWMHRGAALPDYRFGTATLIFLGISCGLRSQREDNAAITYSSTMDTEGRGVRKHDVRVQIYTTTLPFSTHILELSVPTYFFRLHGIVLPLDLVQILERGCWQDTP